MKNQILIILSLLMIGCASIAQTVTIDGITEHEKDKTVYVTVLYNGNSYEFHGDIPLADDPEEYIINHTRVLYFHIVRNIFPGAQWERFKTDERDQLSAIQAWVLDGKRNIVGEDENGDPVYEIIEAVPYKSTHPPWIKLMKEIDTAANLVDIKEILKKIVMRLR